MSVVRRSLPALAGLFLFAFCKTVPIQPPTFDYELLAGRYLESNLGEHFPLTVQRGSNSDPSLSVIPHEDVTKIKNHMFYTTDRNGSRDIWLRDLDSTVDIPIIEHPAEQYAPAVSRDGRRLAYVTEHVDPRGDLRLVAFNPSELIQDTLEGGARANLWDEDTLDLSREVEKKYAQAEPVCRGRARETNPVWHPSGSYLLFVSDRCTPGIENLWRARQDGLGLKIEPVTTAGAVQPAFSGDGRRIAFVSYRNQRRRGEIYLREESSGKTRRVALPAGPANDAFIYLYPSLSADGTTLHYVSIREDTNGNGYHDPNDFGAIYRVTLPGEPFAGSGGGLAVSGETQLVENSSRLFSLTRGFLKDSLLYSAERAGAVNVYLILKDGIVPRRKNIDEQYRLAERYRDSGTRRYFLALDAVRSYFGETLEFLVYEGRLLVDKLQALPRGGEKQKRTLRADLTSAAARNPYAGLERDLLGRDRNASIRTLRGFIAREARRQPCDARCKLRSSAARERLARLLDASGRTGAGLEVVRRLIAGDPDYFRRDRALRLLGDLELKTSARIPGAYIGLVKAEDTAPDLKESILNEVFSFYYNDREPRSIERLVAGELNRKDLPGPLRSSLLLARSSAHYDERNFEHTIADANTALPHTNPRSGLYVQAYQLIAFAQERRGAFEAAFQARRKYAEIKSAAAGARLNPEEYDEILQEFDRRIEEFLRDARALAEVAGRRERKDFDKPGEVRIQVGGRRERIVEFCTPGSYSNAVYRGLGPKFARTYDDFCAELADYRSGKIGEMTLAQVMRATEIFYQAATADANALNILFFNLKRAGLFPGLYDRAAVRYHRRKVEIVLERNRHRVEWQKNRFRILNKLEGFVQEEDPFDEGPFNEILTGYGTALPFARDFGDLSMIYGAAYALIQRSLERERLYDEILEEGAVPTDDSLLDKKEAILRDLKTADYHLQYILYVDPVHVDAYLLRGWLYEYLEYRRGSPLKRKPAFVDRAFNFFTFTTAPAVTEGDFYADSFDSYFPDRLFEENIESYRQALDRLRLRGITDPGKRAALRLNLANNYFHLLNFGRALENYDIVRELGGSFTGFRQKAIFHYNRGRSLYYQGRSREAAAEFETAFKLYEENEREPLHREYAELIFALEGARGTNGGRGAGENWRSRRESLAGRIDAVRTRMALLSALIGLSRWEAGQHEQAILAYQDARRRLYGDRGLPGETENGASESGADEEAGHERHGKSWSGRQRVEDTALLNFIALAYQSRRDLPESDAHAGAASERAREQGLSRDDRRYRPGSLGGRVLGCIIDYGEDFSVIGEGRNPYGFAPLRHYHLALGIKLENMILRGDLEGARELLKLRRETFKDHDGDVQLGQIGVVNSLNQEAFTRYAGGDYVTAEKLFRRAADRARDDGFLAQFERNFYNRFYSLFARFERAPPDDRTALKAIGRARDEMQKFRETYRERAKIDYIAQKRIEFPEFEFEKERDDPVVDARVTREIVEAEAILGTLEYYAGFFRERGAGDARELETAFAEYRRATERFDVALETMIRQFGENSLPVFRVRINRAQALSAEGRLLAAREELEDLAEKSFEFNLIRENWESRWRLSRVLERLSRRHAPGDQLYEMYRSGIAEQLEAGLAAALQDRPTPPAPDGPIEDFFDFAAAYYVKENRPDRALSILESAWERYLRQEYARYPLRFDDPEFNLRFQKYRDLRLQSFNLSRAEQALRLKRRGLKAVRAERAKIDAQLADARGALLTDRPSHRPFLTSAPPEPRLAPGQVLLRLFLGDEYLAVWKFKPNRRGHVFLRQARGSNPAASLREALGRALDGETAAPVLVTGPRLFRLEIESILREVRPDLPAPTFATRVRADHRPVPDFLPDAERSPSVATSKHPAFFYYNVRTVSSERERFANADVIVAPAFQKSAGVFTLARKAFPFREWLTRPRFASAVFFPTPADLSKKEILAAAVSDRRFYRRQAAAFEVLRAAGTGSLIAGPQQAVAAAVKVRHAQRYTAQPGLRVFGAAGPGNSTGTNQMRMGREVLARAEALEARENIKAARSQYDLACSLFWTGPDATPRNDAVFRARLGALRTRLLLAPAPVNNSQTNGRAARRQAKAEREKVAELIKTTLPPLEQDFPERRDLIREDTLAALYRSGFTETARAFKQDYPASVSRRPSPLLEFLTRLRAPVYGESARERNAFAEDLSQARPYLRRRSADLDHLEDFLRHARHREARSLLSELQPSDAVRDWRATIALDGHLLQPPRFAPPADSGDLPPHLRRILAPLHGRSVPEHLRADGIQLTAPNARFRTSLLEAWAARAGAEPVNLSQLTDVTLAGGHSAYGTLPRIERLVLLRLLLDSLHDKPRGDTSARLKRLIRVESNFGRERAALMSLAAAQAYLNVEQPAAALGFFRSFLEHAKVSIPGPDHGGPAARIGLALATTGEAPDLAARRESLEKVLADAGQRSLARLFRRFPERIDDDACLEFSRFAWSLLDGERGRRHSAWGRHVLSGVRLLKYRAFREKRWAVLFNLSVWEESLRFSLAPRSRDTTPVPYRVLSDKLPAGPGTNQVFIALIDVGGALVRLTLGPNGLTAEELPHGSFDLRFRLGTYLQHAFGDSGDGRTSRDLGRLYRSFLSSGQGRLTYYWASGVHATAPVFLERGDRIFQVMDPVAFVAATPRRLGDEYRAGFRVNLAPPATSGGVGGWQARLNTMERLALGDLGPGPPYHRSAAPVAGRSARPGVWFFAPESRTSGARGRFIPSLLRRQYRLRRTLARNFSGPGIYTVHRARSHAHPFFLKFFYSRSVYLKSVHRRLINAYFQQRRRYGDEYYLYGYHLATTTPLKE